MTTLSPAAIAGYAQKAGFSGNGLVLAVAVALTESGGVTNATGMNRSGSGRQVTSIDRGLWQINNVYHPEVSDACAYDPACCAQAAYRISRSGTNWTPWTTFTTGAYRTNMSAAMKAVQDSQSVNLGPLATAQGSNSPSSTGTMMTLALTAPTASDQLSITTESIGPTTDDPMAAYRVILALVVMAGALWALAKTRAGYAAIYYGESLILFFLVATQSTFFKEALSPLTKMTQPHAD